MKKPVHALPIVSSPLAGESAVGFMMRLADINGLSYPWLFEHIAGGRHNPDHWDDAQWQRLADFALVHVDELDGMRCRPVPGRRQRNQVTFLGTVVRRSYLSLDQLRLCPLCLAEGGTMREAWKLIHWVACVEHGTYLVDRCDCSRPVHLVRRGPGREPLPDCCPCGKSFSRISTRPASEAALATTRWLVQLLGPRLTATTPRLWLEGPQLDAPFDGLSRTVAPDPASINLDDLDLPRNRPPLPQTVPMHVMDAVAILELIGRVATTPASEDLARTSRTFATTGRANDTLAIGRTIASVEAAMRVLRGWPDAWHTLLDEVAGRNAVAGDTTPADLFATEMGRLMLDPHIGVDGYPMTVLTDETRRWLERRGYRLRPKIVARTSRVARRLLGVLPLGVIAGILGERVGPGLRRSYHQAIAELDAEDIGTMADEQLAEALLTRTRQFMEVVDRHASLCVVAETLCSRERRTGGAVWNDPRLLQPVRIESTAHGRSKGDVFAITDIIDMQVRLAKAVRRVVPSRIPEKFERYGDVAQTTVSILYTASDLIVDILSGEVPAVTTVAAPTLADLRIPRHAVKGLAVAARVRHVASKDSFMATNTVASLLNDLWGNRRRREFMKGVTKMRSSGAIRFEERLDEAADKIRYRNAAADCLREAEAMFGPTGIAGVDAVLRQLRANNISQYPLKAGVR